MKLPKFPWYLAAVVGLAITPPILMSLMFFVLPQLSLIPWFVGITGAVIIFLLPLFLVYLFSKNHKILAILFYLFLVFALFIALGFLYPSTSDVKSCRPIDGCML